MPTILQKSLEMPLLFEIAVGYSGNVRARRKRDVPQIVAMIGRLFGVPVEEQASTRPFYNEVLWAKKDLEGQGLLCVHPRVAWQVTEKGYEQLRSCFLREIANKPREEARYFLRERDENNVELLLAALKHLDAATMANLVARCDDPLELFIEAVKQLDHQALVDLLCSYYEHLHFNGVGGGKALGSTAASEQD